MVECGSFNAGNMYVREVNKTIKDIEIGLMEESEEDVVNKEIVKFYLREK